MSSDANCSFCSKVDDAIHVICEKRCLICAHCQRSSGIRHLLINCLEMAADHSSSGVQSDPQCPLCHHPMAPNMVTNVKRLRKEMSSQVRLTASDALLEVPNALRQVARKRELKASRSTFFRQQSGGGGRRKSMSPLSPLQLSMLRGQGNNASLKNLLPGHQALRQPSQKQLMEGEGAYVEDTSSSSSSDDDDDDSLVQSPRERTASFVRSGSHSPNGKKTTRKASTINTRPSFDSKRRKQSNVMDLKASSGRRQSTAMRPENGTRRQSSFRSANGVATIEKAVDNDHRPSLSKGNSAANLLSPTSPSKMLLRQRQQGSKTKLESGEYDEFSPALVTQMQQQPVYTQQMALDLMVDVYVRMWTAYIQDNFEPLSFHLRQALSRGRMSKNMIDAKVMNVMDYFAGIQAESNYDPLFGGANNHHSYSGHGTSNAHNNMRTNTDFPNGSAPETPPVWHSNLMSPVTASRPASSGPINIAGAYSIVNTHVYLFGKLLGLQPELQATVCPMQGYIAVIVMAMAVCDRCLRNNSLLAVSDDGSGALQPTASEFMAKICPVHLAAKQPLTGKKLMNLTIKKAISILKCLIQTDEFRFNMCALKSACVEYGVPLPWQDASSLTALLSCFVSLEVDGRSLLVKYYREQRAANEAKAIEVIQSMGSDGSNPAGNTPNANNANTTNAPLSNAPTPGFVSKFKKNASSNALHALNNVSGSSQAAEQHSANNFPPLNELHAAVRKIWEEKRGLKPISFDIAIDACKARGQLMSLPYFVAVCVEGWKAELEHVMKTIRIHRQANLRRHGLKPHLRPFEKSILGLRISHRKALRYIYDAYADKSVSTFEDDIEPTGASVSASSDEDGEGFIRLRKSSVESISSHESLKDTMRTGINWDEVRERALRKQALCPIPFLSNVKQFMNKANAELEYLACFVLLQSCKQRQWLKLLDGHGWDEEWCWGGIQILKCDEEAKGPSSNIRHVLPPRNVEQHAWDVLCMCTPAGEQEALRREKAMNRSDVTETVSRETLRSIMRQTIHQSSKQNAGLDDTRQGKDAEDLRIKDQVRSGSKGLSRSLSRSSSIKDFVQEDFHMYFKETNVRTTQIQKSFKDFSSSRLLSPIRYHNEEEEKNCFVVCDMDGGHTFDLKSQLYLKKEPRNVPKFSSKHLITPAAMAPHLQLKSYSRPASQWESPLPMRHRVHMTDIIGAKNNHSDILIKTGLLKPLSIYDTQPKHEDSEYTGEASKHRDESEEMTEKNESEANSESSPMLHASASAPTVHVLSSLNKLEFTVPPEKLSKRLLEVEGDEVKEEHDSGLVFRSMSPAGARSRQRVDLGHFSNMRPSEQPQLSENARLESLNLADSFLSISGFASALENLAKHKRAFQFLRQIDISSNKICDQGLQHLSDALSDNCVNICDINIRGNKITDTGAVELLLALLDGGGEKSLLKLDLSNNAITLKQPRLSELLIRMTRLRVLDLSWNSINLVTTAERTSAKQIVEQCRNLQALSFSYNRMGDAGVCELLKALETASAMQIVDLAYCFCTEKILEPLLALVKCDHGSAGVALLMLHGVALPLAATDEVLAVASSNGRKVILEGHHTGISINTKYV